MLERTTPRGHHPGGLASLRRPWEIASGRYGISRASLVLASVLVLGCGGSPAPVKAGAATIARQATTELRMPTPGRGRLGEAVRQNAGCEACHADVAREWRGSLHQRADIEPAYRRAFAIEPLPFCRSCHAPEAIPHEEEPLEVAELGVGCVSCHLTGDDDRVLAAPRAGHLPEKAPHAVVRDARFATASACASCHEFPFPGLPGRDAAELMQSTVREHAASRSRDVPCAGCHMPELGGSRRSHAFVASRSEEVVRSAVDIDVERLHDRVRVVLRPKVSGHAFPTGDLFRRVEVSIESLGPDRLVLSREQRYLARHFELAPGTVGRRLSHDDRVHDEPRIVEVLTPTASGHEIAYRVAYQRVAHPLDASFEEAVVEGEIVLAEGLLAPP
jgi:hypothetical protein